MTLSDAMRGYQDGQDANWLDTIDDLAVVDILIDPWENGKAFNVSMLADGDDGEPVVVATGTGATRREAVLNAVAKAQGKNG